MCDKLIEGGRRCPCNSPARRAMQRAEKKRTETVSGEPFKAHTSVVATNIPPTELIQQYLWNSAQFETELKAYDEKGSFSKQKELDTLKQNYDILMPSTDKKRLGELQIAARQERQNFIHELEQKYPSISRFPKEAQQKIGAAIGQAAERSVLPEGVTLQEHIDQLQKSCDEADKEYEEKNQEYKKARSIANDLQKKVNNGEHVDSEKMNAAITERQRALKIQNEVSNKRLDARLAKIRFGEGLSEAYLQELQKIRSFGGKVEWSNVSDRKAVRTLNKALRYYPTAWIEYSNRSTQMVAKTTQQRAHYKHDGAFNQKIEKVDLETRRQFANNVEKEKFEQTILNDPQTDLVELSTQHISGEISFQPPEVVLREYEVSFPESHIGNNGEIVYHQNDDYLNKKPKGTRWSLDTMPNGTKFWRRNKQEKAVTGKAIGSEILSKYDNVSIATHELAHRMEATVPGVLDAEKNFWDSREGNEIISQIPNYARGEVGIRDNFVDAYMGKVYPEKSSFEALSMGMEAVFHQKNGGLIGMDSSRKLDTEMRDFILGTLATVGIDDDPSYLAKKA